MLVLDLIKEHLEGCSLVAIAYGIYALRRIISLSDGVVYKTKIINKPIIQKRKIYK